MNSTVNIILLTLCGLLAYQLYQETLTNRPGNNTYATVSSGKPAVTGKMTPDALTMIGSIEQYTAMVQRPLFNETRKPLVKKKIVKSKPASRKKPAPKPETFDAFLSAVILVEDKQFALLTGTKSKVTEKVYPGDTILGWKVTGITPRTVILTKGPKTKTLVLEIVGSTGQPSLPPRSNTGIKVDHPVTRTEKVQAGPVSGE